MTDKPKCSERIFRDYTHYPCQHPAVVERDGKWYCKIHDPEYVKAKREEWAAKLQAQFAADKERYRRQIAETAACAGIPTEVLDDFVKEYLAACRKYP
ncbi:MAG: hypothetical protein WC683_20090 [bacterium]